MQWDRLANNTLVIVLGGGQAVVLHRLAIMSKDGDWVLFEDEEAVSHVLSVLAGHGSRYRFGAPLDLRWMRGGWSSHFEFRTDVLRVRTDFVTRPPRLTMKDIQQMWTAPDKCERRTIGVLHESSPGVDRCVAAQGCFGD